MRRDAPHPADLCHSARRFTVRDTPIAMRGAQRSGACRERYEIRRQGELPGSQAPAADP
jgi:hypothetical protein